MDVIGRSFDAEHTSYVIPIQTKKPAQLKLDIEAAAKSSGVSCKWLYDAEVQENASAKKMPFNSSQLYTMIGNEETQFEKIYFFSLFRLNNATAHVNTP